MDLRRLGLFLAVVDHGGFTAAAQAVHVAQPAVSLAVRELEAELRAPLFVRARAGATLTPAGEALVGPARQAQRDIDIAMAAVAAVTGLLGGRLDLASLPTLAADPVAALVGRFRLAHPAVTVRLAAPTDSADLAHAIRSGQAEIGITEQGVGTAGLVERAISHQELVAVSPPGTTPAGAARTMSLRALAAEPLVVTRRGTSVRRVLERALAALDIDITPLIAVETAQRDALIPLVLAGAGTAVLPATLAAAAGALGAMVRPLRPHLRRQVVLTHRPGVLSPAAASFIGIAFARR